MIIYQLVLWDPPVNYYSISRRQRSIFNPRHSASWHQLSGTLCHQLPNAPLPSLLSSHIWKPNCSLLHMTPSNFSSAAGASDSNSRLTAPPTNVVDIDIDIDKMPPGQNAPILGQNAPCPGFITNLCSVFPVKVCLVFVGMNKRTTFKPMFVVLFIQLKVSPLSLCYCFFPIEVSLFCTSISLKPYNACIADIIYLQKIK